MKKSIHHIVPAPFRRALLSWYSATDRALPWRQRWHDTRDPYCVWVSEIMLQQTLIKVVIPAYERFMVQFPTVEALARSDEEEVRLTARGLGYYRRFGMLHRGAQEVTKQRVKKGKTWWPDSSTEWREISGIGPYTAAAIASITRDEPIHVLDGNVERVLCRMLAIKESIGTPTLKKQLNPIAADLLDPKRAGDFNQAMMELGQLVCTKANPSCERCPVAPDCLAKKYECQSEAPRPKKREDAVDVHLLATIAIRPRPGKKRANEVGLMWRERDARFLKESWGFSFSEGKTLPKGAKVVGQFTHSITKHRIAVTVAFDLNAAANRWIPDQEVESQLLANLDRKAWKILQGAVKRETASAPNV